jgi:hypothetical protein
MTCPQVLRLACPPWGVLVSRLDIVSACRYNVSLPGIPRVQHTRTQNQKQVGGGFVLTVSESPRGS